MRIILAMGLIALMLLYVGQTMRMLDGFMTKRACGKPKARRVKIALHRKEEGTWKSRGRTPKRCCARYSAARTGAIAES